MQVLSLIQEMLPHVSALNLLTSTTTSQVDGEATHCQPSVPFTSSQHYTWVESDHPYKSASVSHYKVTFPKTVRWMTVEFMPECATSQPEDYLQLYIPNNSIGYELFLKNRGNVLRNDKFWNCLDFICRKSNYSSDEIAAYWPVLRKLSNVQSQWPQSSVILPGLFTNILYVCELKYCTSETFEQVAKVEKKFFFLNKKCVI